MQAKLSVRSWMEITGRTSIRLFAKHARAPGWLHSTSLIGELGEDDPELVELIKNPPPDTRHTARLETNLTLYPGDLLVPAALLPIIRSESMGSLEQHIFPVN